MKHVSNLSMEMMPALPIIFAYFIALKFASIFVIFGFGQFSPRVVFSSASNNPFSILGVVGAVIFRTIRHLVIVPEGPHVQMANWKQVAGVA